MGEISRADEELHQGAEEASRVRDAMALLGIHFEPPANRMIPPTNQYMLDRDVLVPASVLRKMADRLLEEHVTDECEVCRGTSGGPATGAPVATMTLDATGQPWPVALCQPCLEAVLALMTDRWNDSIDRDNAAVAELKRWLGIDGSQEDT